MATIEKRTLADGSTAFRVRIRVKGQSASRTFDTMTEARTWARDMEADLGRRKITLDQTRSTLREAIARYCREKLPELRDRRKREGHLRWWEAKLGHLRLVDVTAAVISRAREDLEAEPVRQLKTPLRAIGARTGRRSPASSNRYLASLSAVLGVARKEWQIISANPAAQVKKRREPKGRIRFLDQDERRRLLAAVGQADDWRLAPLVALALYTGARAGELLSLRWSDIDLQRRFATVHGTKNGETRSLPLAAPAFEALRGLHRSRRRIGTELVFAGSTDAVFPRRAWEEAVRRAELDDFSFHDLRHSAASYFAMTGASMRDLAELLGHKTLAMVKRYSHLTRDHLLTAAERMAEAFPAEKGP